MGLFPSGLSGPRLIALDLETTGTDVRHDRIVELCIIGVDHDLAPQGVWECRFNPGRPIPSEATGIHGIGDLDVVDKPRFEAWAPHIQGIVEDAVIIAYNGTRFDLPLLHNELRRAGQPGLPPTPATIDPFSVFKQDSPRSMEAAYRHYTGEPPASSHAARADCETMLRILKEQCARRKAVPLDLRYEYERTWLDHERRFYRDGSGVNRFAFGKHRDEDVQKHPDYLNWMLQADFSPDTQDVAERLLREATWLEWEAANACVAP